MNSKYKVLKYRSNNTNEIEDSISIEEPLEITIKFKNKKKLGLKILFLLQ